LVNLQHGSEEHLAKQRADVSYGHGGAQQEYVQLIHDGMQALTAPI
jgi:hypothetical protein